METKELIEHCLRGERKAQREMIKSFGGKIMVICRRYSNQTLEANDIFQESWIKIFSVLDQFDSEKGKFDAWIYRISVNVALKLIQKNLKHQNIEDISEPIHTNSISDYQSADQDSLYKELLQQIETLPQWQKLIFNLNVIEGYNHDEIADQLGITASTSRSQLSRAKKKLRDLNEGKYA